MGKRVEGGRTGRRRAGLTRREFVQLAGGAGLASGLSAFPLARADEPLPRPGALGVLDAREGPVDMRIARTPVAIGGRRGEAVTINGVLPAPLLRLREGAEAVMRVTNALDEVTSIHWHGMIVPNGMDGVPKVNFPGIHPGETFVYRFPVRQSGTYWYHSHSRLQEQLGHYGPIVVEGRRPPPFAWDREQVVVLSDWTFDDPYRLFARLKKQSDYYNFQKRTVGDFFRDVGKDGLGAALSDRLTWGRMRMSPTDISDVTGATYSYLVNGAAPEDDLTLLVQPKERVLLRFVNASAASFLDVRIPGLRMKLVEVSGQNVEPVEVEEIRIAIAETYAVLVEPAEDRAYTLFVEAMDRSGFGRATLAPRAGMQAPLPERRKRPLLTMADMGMGGMAGMEMEGAKKASGEENHAAEGHGAMGQGPMDRGPMEQPRTETGAPRPPGALPEPKMHAPDSHGPGNAVVPMMTKSRLDEPGIGLGEDGWKVLTYAMLRALEPRRDFRPPDREIELHLTGNMERFMWSIDGVEFHRAKPVEVRHGERIRLVMVNDTMMNHPMHLHGVFMELENGHGDRIPSVHTVNVKPAERVSLLFTASEVGPWAFHCHVLYHMEAGMFRVVRVSDPAAGTSPVAGAESEVTG